MDMPTSRLSFERFELDPARHELRADGELDSVGEFTLDRRRAREKMRHFQLVRHKPLYQRSHHLCHLQKRSKILHYLRPLQKYLCLHYLRHKIKWRTWTCLRTMKLMFHPLRLPRNRVKTIT